MTKGITIGKRLVRVIDPPPPQQQVRCISSNNGTGSIMLRLQQRQQRLFVNIYETTVTSIPTGTTTPIGTPTTTTTNTNNSRRLRTFVTTNTTDKKPSLKETVERIQQQQEQEKAASESQQQTTATSSNEGEQDKGQPPTSSTFAYGDLLRRGADVWDQFKRELSSTWQELVQSGERKSINKKIVNNHPTETAGGDAPYTGSVEIMMIDPELHLTAWERMQKRLTKAPIIQRILEQTEVIYEKSGAKKVKERVDHIKEDAREAWETSQNPWVYRISSVYDTVTAESPETRAVAELRILDPTFTLEDWRQDVVEHTLPIIMKWFLQGRINQLKPWLGEGVFKRIAAEMTAREREGTQIDTNVLAIMNSEIIAVEADDKEKGSPIIILHFMCQQINCVRKKKTGEIVEGSEDDIRANSYVVAFQREYNEAAGELNWKIIDFRFNGAIAYL